MEEGLLDRFFRATEDYAIILLDRQGAVRGWNPGAEYGIFESIRQKQPDVMLWLGDNVYMRDLDWTTRTGMLQRYAFGRAVKELQPLLGSVHHYAIWDDHDYGPNDADRSYRDKEVAREVFQLFWGNPSYGVPGRDGTRGVNFRFTWADVEFLTPMGARAEDRKTQVSRVPMRT